MSKISKLKTAASSERFQIILTIKCRLISKVIAQTFTMRSLTHVITKKKRYCVMSPRVGMAEQLESSKEEQILICFVFTISNKKT